MMDILKRDLEMEKVFYKPRLASNIVEDGKIIEDMEMESRDMPTTVNMLVSL